jgi:hypothetical protein
LDVGRGIWAMAGAKRRRTQMERTGKMVAWACMCSTLFMGCYTSVMVEPTGEGKEKIYSDRIYYVITKDGTKYEFEKAPAIAKDTIVGEVKIHMEPGFITKQVSIPVSDVVKANVSQFELGSTIWAGVGTVVLAIFIFVAWAVKNLK